MNKRILIIDSNSLIHRAFHAIPHLESSNKGLVGAVYGFLSILLRVIKETEPNCIVACFDFPAPSFRQEKHKEYKATREKTPDELKDQFPKVKEILKAFDIPIFEKKGFEGDDLIGTVSEKTKKDMEVIVVSGDRDMLQLIDKNVKVFLLKKGIQTSLYNEEKFVEEYGFNPDRLIEYKALVGDSSDNICGARGIGPKTAVSLVKKFGTIEKMYSGLESGKELEEIKEKTKELLLKEKENVFISRFLVEIKKDVDIDFKMKDCSFEYDYEKVINVLNDFGFKSLIPKIQGGPEQPLLQEKDEQKDKEPSGTTKRNLSLW